MKHWYRRRWHRLQSLRGRGKGDLLLVNTVAPLYRGERHSSRSLHSSLSGSRLPFRMERIEGVHITHAALFFFFFIPLTLRHCHRLSHLVLRLYGCADFPPLPVLSNWPIILATPRALNALALQYSARLWFSRLSLLSWPGPLRVLRDAMWLSVCFSARPSSPVDYHAAAVCL